MTKSIQNIIGNTKLILTFVLLVLAVFSYQPIRPTGANFQASTGDGEMDFQITTSFWAPDAPSNLGYNVKNSLSDNYALPRPTTEIACGGITNINGVSHHWTDVAAGNPLIKYERQYDVPGTPGDVWQGSEIYPTPYTDFRVFGGDPGTVGKYNSRVRAFTDTNNNSFLDVGEAVSDWSANSCNITYDNLSPSVKINSPLDGASLSGIVPIYATVTDDNPKHYWLVMQTMAGATVAGPGTVNNSNSFTNQLVYNWNTTSLAPGQYKIKLEARDLANNKTPNAAPVASDPEVLGDSVDWITVVVNDNTAPAVPTPLLPADGEVLRDTELYIDWSDSTDDFSNPVTYDYELFTVNPDTNPDPDVPIYTVNDTLNSRHPSAGFAIGTPETTYWWRVRACDSAGNCSAWTTAWELTVDNSAPLYDVVLNEIMYDPIATESASMPDGEWVELYNNGGSNIDVSGWYIKDSAANVRTIAAVDSDNNLNLLDAGESVIPSGGWLVFYLPGAAILNNGSSDTLTLYDNLNQVVDTHTYLGDKTEGMTEARIPDGTGAFVDPLPTPGRANVLSQEDLEPMARLWQQEASKFRFSLFDAINYQTAEYTITYTHSGTGSPVTENIIGSFAITSQYHDINDIYLGTCSTGGTCTPHTLIDPNSIDLEIKLSGPSIPDNTFNEPLTGVFSQ